MGRRGGGWRWRAALAAAWASTVTQTAAQLYTSNATAAEVAFAASLGGVRPSGIDLPLTPPTPIGGWIGAGYAPSVGLLFGAPFAATAVLVVNPRTHEVNATAVGSFSAGSSKWIGMAYAPTVDLLFGSPFDARGVLIVNPQTNATDSTSLIINDGTVDGDKYHGIAYCPTADLLFCAPYDAPTVLIINPRTNATDRTVISAPFSGESERKWTGIVFVPSANKLSDVLVVDPITNSSSLIPLTRNTGHLKFEGVAYAASVDKIYFAPYNADHVLVVDPQLNGTQNRISAINTPPVAGAKYNAVAFIPTANYLVFCPSSADTVLIIDVRTNTPVDNSSARGLYWGTGGGKWQGANYVPEVDQVFLVPHNIDRGLAVGVEVDRAVLTPFQLITDLTNQLNSTQHELRATGALLTSSLTFQRATADDLVATRSTLTATQSNLSIAQAALQANQSAIAADLQSTLVSQTSLQAGLTTVGATVCNVPACGVGTRPVNGSCLPDCPSIRRRGVDCAPFCDPANDGVDSDSGSSGLDVAVLIGVLLAVGAALALVVVGVHRHRATAPSGHPRKPALGGQSLAMYVNPLHTGPAGHSELDAESEASSEPAVGLALSDSTDEPPSMYERPVAGGATSAESTVALDPNLYVAPEENRYSTFRGEPSGGTKGVQGEQLYRKFCDGPQGTATTSA